MDVGTAPANFSVLDKEMCDDGMRYIVTTSRQAAVWLVENYAKGEDYFWVEGPRGVSAADISEEVLTLMTLRWM